MMRRVARVQPVRFLATLREPLANAPASQPEPSIDPAVKRSTTPGGVDVVTVDRNSAHSGACVSFRAGSRFESPENAGAAAQLSKLLYFANASGKTNVAVTRDLLMSTSDRHANASREVLSYSAQFPRDNAAHVVEQLGAIAQPLARSWEVADSRVLLEEDSFEDEMSYMLDSAHWVAFRGHPIGKAPKPVEVGISDVTLREYRDSMLTRANAVVVGVGVEHDAFASAVDEAFGGLPKGKKAESPSAIYVGGESHVEGGDHPALVIAANGGAFGSTAHMAAGVLQALLGRTAERYTNKPRPGHGLTSRLNRRLSSEADVLYADAFTTAYSDSGLFGFMAKAVSGREQAVADALMEELHNLASKPLADSELQGAKRRFKYALLASSEDTDAMAHFYAQQALLTSNVLTREAFAAQVDALTANDVQAAVKNMLASRLTLATEGNSCNVTLKA